MSDTQDCAVSSLIQSLVERSRRTDPTDLPGLAQMHGWCENLARLASQPEHLAPELGRQAQALARELEGLILGEATDATAALAEVIASVEQLVATAQAASPQVEQSETSAPPSECSDAEIAERLDKVFADEPPVDPPPAPAASGESNAPDEEAYEQQPLIINEKELEFVKGFVEEALEHIESVEAAVLEVERCPEDRDKVNDLFRPFHTIKGMAGFLNLRDINCLTHEVETLLDQARKGQRPVTPGVIDVVFDVVDILKAQVNSIAAYLAAPDGRPVQQPPVAQMIGRLRGIISGRLQPEARTPGAVRPSQRIGDTLVEQGVVAREVVEFALELQKQNPGTRTGELLVELGAATPRQVGQALRTQAASVADHSVRIETGKLDALVDMVGELVIAQTLVGGSEAVQADSRLSKNVNQVTKIVRTVQEVVLAMRMIPIGSTFQKMARLVRDVSRKAGKQVELTISGEDTELDKNVIQQISDPLVHMVRNAIDHGIESPEDRTAAGKPQVGRVHLSACHEGGNIVIEISDDGKGLDPQKLTAKAIEKGLIPAGTELTEQQAFQLIFAPGFSTADQVTDISGRGVGMDVVKRNIEALRGKVEIISERGCGTTFQIRLPLTLAIIDGMVVALGRERFIIPTIMLEQALCPTPEQLTTVQHRGEMIQVRGQLIPLIQLGELFGITDWIDPTKAMVVIAHSDGKAVGLVVEELIGQQQVVIKSLGDRFEKLRGISGAAILGDGRVGLILEMAGLALLNEKRRGAQRRRVTARRTDAGAPNRSDDTLAALAADTAAAGA